MSRIFRALAARVARFFSRRAAQSLLAQGLPRGLPAAARPFPLALRAPRALEAFGQEYFTLPLGAEAIRGRAPARLFRLAALPPAPQRLVAVRKLTLPVEVDPLRTAADASPRPREPGVRPRMPLPRAPLLRFRPANFRLDPGTGLSANEGILPLEARATTYRWVLPAFRREKLDLPWMAGERIAFLGPLQSEWFARWWDAAQARKPGAKEPYPYVLSEELDFALESVKEQMLIRRDVKKDENPPEEQQFYFVEVGHPIAALDTPPLPELLPRKEWVGRPAMVPPPPLHRAAHEAYLQWRTLVDALEER